MLAKPRNVGGELRRAPSLPRRILGLHRNQPGIPISMLRVLLVGFIRHRCEGRVFPRAWLDVCRDCDGAKQRHVVGCCWSRRSALVSLTRARRRRSCRRVASAHCSACCCLISLSLPRRSAVTSSPAGDAFGHQPVPDCGARWSWRGVPVSVRLHPASPPSGPSSTALFIVVTVLRSGHAHRGVHECGPFPGARAEYSTCTRSAVSASRMRDALNLWMRVGTRGSEAPYLVWTCCQSNGRTTRVGLTATRQLISVSAACHPGPRRVPRRCDGATTAFSALKLKPLC